MLRVTLAAVLAAVTIAGGAGEAQKQGRPGPPAPRPAPAAKPAAPKVTEIDEHALKSLLGAGARRVRPLLVNFWATWCTPCREEFPDLVKIREQYAADRLDFITVSLDDPADIDKAVPEFLSEVRAASLPAYLLHAADESVAINLVDPEWSGELPATFLYDRAGNVVFKHKGRVKPEELRAALDQALTERPPEAGARK